MGWKREMFRLKGEGCEVIAPFNPLLAPAWKYSLHIKYFHFARGRGGSLLWRCLLPFPLPACYRYWPESPSDAASHSLTDSPSRLFSSSFPLFSSWPRCTVPAPRRRTARTGWRWPRPRPSPRPLCPWYTAPLALAHTSVPQCVAASTHNRRLPTGSSTLSEIVTAAESTHSATRILPSGNQETSTFLFLKTKV